MGGRGHRPPDDPAGGTLSRSLATLSAGLALAGFAALLGWHLRAILADAPMEMRDGAAVVTTLALLDGRNPYAFPGIATSGNLYGILYPVSVLPFAWPLGPGFVAHHLATATAIWGACLLLWRRMRASCVGTTDALLGIGLVYAGLVYFTGAAARPDGLGVLLMLLALGVMERGDFAPRAYAGGLALSLLAMLAKIYFVWPAFAVAAYVFLCRDMRRGLAYGIAAIAATALAWVAIGLVSPGYIAVVLLASVAATGFDTAHLVRQLLEWTLFSLPLLVAGGLLLAARWRAARWRMFGRDPGLMAAMFGFGMMAILFTLGGHRGAHLSYLFQLLSPFLAVAVLVGMRDVPAARLAFRLLLPLTLVLNAHLFLPPAAAAGEKGCALSATAAENKIAPGRLLLATAELAGQLALAGQPAGETGHSEYFADALDPPPAWLRPLMPPREQLEAEWNGLVDRIRADVAARRYDLILVGENPSQLIPRDLIAAQDERDPPECPQPGAVMSWAQQAWPFAVWRRPR